MMCTDAELACTLLGDGSSDRVLEYPIRWLLRWLYPKVAVQLAWADLARLPTPPGSLREKIDKALRLYPCQILFVHRDAERESRERRVAEIQEAVQAVSERQCPPYVCVVPVRMTEAWFLFDETAIRKAAGNPNGTARLELPAVSGLEDVANPKKSLEEFLATATELSPRRRKRSRPGVAFHRVVQLIEDYGPLRCLPAFRSFEQDLVNTLEEHEWVPS